MSSVDRIFQIMEDRKLTSAFVSKQTGISAGNFTDWKKGRSKPGTKTINRLAEFFGVSSDFTRSATEEMFSKKRNSSQAFLKDPGVFFSPTPKTYTPYSRNLIARGV